METKNISKQKLRGKQIGVVFGTFAPLHIGHQQLIYKALMVNDSALLVVSGSDGDRGDKIGLSLEKRFRYLREAYNDELNLRVALLNENGMPEYPLGWKEWTKAFIGVMRESIVEEFESVTFTIYVSEAEYVSELEKLLPKNCSVEIENRQDISISATEIRQEPMKHWDKINRVFRRHFTKKVLIAGSASTGKSTLVRRLARSLNAPFSEEYARLYEEKANITDEELTVSDYANFILGQSAANYREICSPSNSGITFFDTDAIVTQTYADLYLSKVENEQLKDLFELTIAKESFDLILVIPPVTVYIDDGFRNMEWEESRQEYHNKLMALFIKYGFENKIVLLDAQGKTPQEGFYLRYKQAIEAISTRLNITIAHLK
ncbi:nicotinamide-nucleotide adenylyltransferase [Lactococcus nasutitermitis]|uniref:Nicotinamide-nucleotide adenylyltransferase n=1 Tax=Lactococcus nasutitermitis TaxID=1652957 RepID=A0ABV9JDM8_9LACT|nr:nicotinamide-nucleotide adenylyltransferase [Lactococcus nasutitermitis]